MNPSPVFCHDVKFHAAFPRTVFSDAAAKE
jgi:hypothetical protein